MVNSPVILSLAFADPRQGFLFSSLIAIMTLLVTVLEHIAVVTKWSLFQLKKQESIVAPFPLLDLPPELVNMVISNFNDAALIAARSTCAFFKTETEDRFHTAFFSNIETRVSKKSLQNLVSLSTQPYLARHIRSLVFAIPTHHRVSRHLNLIYLALDGLSLLGTDISLGVASEQNHYTDLVHHVGDMVYLLQHESFVDARDVIRVPEWKFIIRIDNFRSSPEDAPADCFNDLTRFICSEARNLTNTTGTKVEIHDGYGEPTRYINITKETGRTMQVSCINLNCDVEDANDTLLALDELDMLEENDIMRVLNSVAIKDSTIRWERLHYFLNFARIRHLDLEKVRLRYDIQGSEESHVRPMKWLEALEHFIRVGSFNNLASCRFANLRDPDGEVFVEGVWEFTAIPGRTTAAEAIAILIDNVKDARARRAAALAFNDDSTNDNDRTTW